MRLTSPSLCCVSLIAFLSGCDSSGISTTDGSTPDTQSSITVPDTARETLPRISDVDFNGQFETTASPDRGTGISDAETDSDALSVDSTVGTGGTGADSSDGVSIPAPIDPGQSIDPGTLTAGDYDDHLNPHLYQNYAHDYLQNRGQWIDTPRLDFNNRILIQVTGISGQPVADAKVQVTVNNSQTTTLYTAANGQTSVYSGLDSLNGDFTLKVVAKDGTQAEQLIDLQNALKAGQIYVSLATDSQYGTRSTPVDLMFVIDTTGSMRDELRFLQTELSDIINAIPNQQTNTNIGLVFYRDYGDTYVVRAHGFSEDINTVQLNLNQEQAQGGGDYPEAMDQALNAAIAADWRTDSRKVLFLLADAPPHGDRMRATWEAAEKARRENIHLVPIAASGVAEDAEYIMRSVAALTHSRYLFLTDDSGFGLPHAAPDVDCYVVTSLRSTMIRAMNSLVTGQRAEPTDNDIIRSVGNYNNGVCDPIDTPDNPVEYSVLAEGSFIQNGSFTTQRTLVIDNQNTLNDELSAYGQTTIPVDFNTRQVLLVDMGQRNTGGYSISVDSITEFDDYVQADIGLISPGSSCGVTQALTNPFIFMSLTTQKEIRISQSSRTNDCD